MRRSLQGKLILSYLGIALITVLLVSALIRLTSGQSLRSLVMEQQTAQLTESVQNYYANHGNLNGFFAAYLQAGRNRPVPPDQNAAEQGRPEPGAPNPGVYDRRPEMRGVLGLVDPQYQAVIPTFGYDIGQTVPAERIQDAIPVEVDGQTVAWILPDTTNQFTLSPEEQLFLQRTTLAIGLAALVGVLAAVAMGFLLSGRLLEPIRRLTQASQALAHGDLQQHVPVTSQDELGQLTQTFNQMSADLAQADQQRKRMTADITHDLSTPLQIIAGYIEMLEEGVSLTPQRLEIIKTEIGHLRRLVSDLSTLTQVEAGGLDILVQPVAPFTLLQRIYHAYQPIAARQGVELALDAPETAAPEAAADADASESTLTPFIRVDEGRMLQVLKNLVENALRYTPEKGKITLSAEAGDQVQLRVTDTGSGIAPEDLPYVFDRFYRADKARGANSGKMGLGLAICKALVTAQGGTILAEPVHSGPGVSIVMTFPPASLPASDPAG